MSCSLHYFLVPQCSLVPGPLGFYCKLTFTFLLNVAAHCLSGKEVNKGVRHHVGDSGDHSVQSAAPPPDPLLPRRAVLFPQEAAPPFCLLFHVRRVLLFPGPAVAFSAPAATIQGGPPAEPDVSPASVPLDPPVAFPQRVSPSRFRVRSQQTAVVLQPVLH